MTADESLRKLKRGACAYEESGRYAGDVSEYMRRQTASGQHPFATIVTCSDSRVIPEAIFSCGIGELFVVRTAGNVIGAHELASIHYAAHHLHVPLTVVLGHTSCGAVAAALAGETEGDVGVLTKAIQEAIGDEKDPLKATWRNAEAAVRRIRESMQGPGSHQVSGAIYDIASGHVVWMEGGDNSDPSVH